MHARFRSAQGTDHAAGSAQLCVHEGHRDPTMRLQLKASSVAARCSWCCGTSCGVSARRAGSANAEALNSAASSANISLRRQGAQLMVCCVKHSQQGLVTALRSRREQGVISLSKGKFHGMAEAGQPA